MAGGIVADYTIILDSPITLRVGGDIDRTFDFKLPAAALFTNRASAILSFLVIQSTDLHLKIDFNETTVYDRSLGTGGERCIQEVVGPVASSVDNEITFTVVAGDIRLSDVVLWFQRQAKFSLPGAGWSPFSWLRQRIGAARHLWIRSKRS